MDRRGGSYHSPVASGEGLAGLAQQLLQKRQASDAGQWVVASLHQQGGHMHLYICGLGAFKPGLESPLRAHDCLGPRRQRPGGKGSQQVGL